MPLPNISRMPETDAHRQAFSFSHYQDHLEIVQAINAQFGTNLAVQPIHPGADTDSGAWKRQHQALHDAMHSVLKTNGQDLTGEWNHEIHYQNYQEHNAVRQKLGI